MSTPKYLYEVVVLIFVPLYRTHISQFCRFRRCAVPKGYYVGLLWKAGHKALPTNYENSLIRLKSLGKKLRKGPPTLAKYNEIIND